MYILNHINGKVDKAYSMFSIIKRNFLYLNKHSFVSLYKAMVRPHLEYANSVWCLYKKETSKLLKRYKKELLS